MPDPSLTNPITSSIEDDPDMIEIIDMFIDDLPKRVAIISEAFEQQAWSQIRTISHQLKGAAPGYGFESIGVAAAKLEELLIESAGIDEIEKASKQLAELCGRVAKS